MCYDGVTVLRWTAAAANSWNGNACCWQFSLLYGLVIFIFHLDWHSKRPPPFRMLVPGSAAYQCELFAAAFTARTVAMRMTYHICRTEWMTQFPSGITSIDLNKPGIDPLPTWQISPIWIIYAHLGITDLDLFRFVEKFPLSWTFEERSRLPSER